MSVEPFFGVVVPTHERPELLNRLLTSVTTQTFKNFSVVVVDDASACAPLNQDIVRRHSSACDIRYVLNPTNQGPPRSRARGVDACGAKWIALVDDDDEWLPAKLESQAKLIQSASDVGLVYSWADVRDKSGHTVYRYRSDLEGQLIRDILGECFIPSPTAVIRRDVLNAIGGFDPAMPSCQDWDTWTRAIAIGAVVKVTKEVLAIHHKHDGPSVGRSSRAIEGFLMFYRKHKVLYETNGLAQLLSERLRGVAYDLRLTDPRIARQVLEEAIRTWPLNLKAYARLVQLAIFGQ